MDVFIEKLVIKKKTILDNLLTGLIIFLAALLILVILNIKSAMTFAPLLICMVGYVAFHLVRTRNVEFEYAVTNGDLDIDKITAKKNRKRLFSANCKEFEVVAKVKSPNYDQNAKSINKKIVAVTSMDAESVYFAILHYKGQKTIVFFEPDDKMLNAFKAFIPKKVIT